MRIKWAYLTVLLCAPVAGWAADYELVIPNTGAQLKHSPALVVYGPGALKAGDRIVSVRFGGGKVGSTAVSVEGRNTFDGPILSKDAEVGEFVGKVYLGAGDAPDKAVGASIAEVAPGAAASVAAAAKAAAANPDALPPWVFWVGGAIGLGFLLLFLRSNMSGKVTLPAGPIGPSRRSSIGEIFTDVQNQISKMSETQHELLANPPGMKELKKKLGSIEERLAKIETAGQAAAQASTKISSALIAAEKHAAELSAGSETTQKTLAELKRNVDALNVESANRGADFKKQTSSAQQAIDAVRNAVAANETAIAKSAESIRAVEQRFDQVEQRLDSAFESVGGKLDDVAKQAAKQELVSSAVNKLTERLSGIEAKPSLATADIAPIAEGIRELTEKTQAALTELDRRLLDLRSTVDEFSQRDDRSASIDSRLVEISAKFEDVDERLSAMPAPISDLQPLAGRLDELSRRFSEIEEKLSAPAKETFDPTPLESQLAEIAARVDALSAQIAQVPDNASEVAAMERTLGQLSDSVKLLQQQADAQKDPAIETTQLYDKLEDLSAQLVALQHRVEEQQFDSQQTAQPAVASVEPAAAEEPEADQDFKESMPGPTIILDPPQDVDLESDDADDLDLVSPKGWAGMRGTAEGRCSAEFHRGMKLSSDEKPNLLHPVDSPMGTSPVGGPIAYGRRLLYTHGQTVRGFWPGREDRAISLPEEPPTDEWRLLQSGSAVFCVGESTVHIGDLNSWARKTSFPGKYFAQTHNGEHWVGAFEESGSAFLDFRTIRGEQAHPPVALSVSAGGLEVVASGTDVFAYSLAGEIVKVAAGSAKQVGAFSGSIVRVCRHKDAHLALVHTDKGLLIELVDDHGKRVGYLQLNFSAEPEAFVAMGSRLYLFDQDKSEFVAIDLRKMSVAQRWASSDVARVRKLSGIQSARAHFLAVVGASGEKNTGRAFVVDVKTGDEYNLCQVLEPFVSVIPVDTHVAVVTRCSYQNIVRVFAPFESIYVAKAA